MPSFFCIPLACNRQIDSLDRRQNNLQAVPHDIDRYRGLEELLLAMNHIKELPKTLFRLTKLRLLDLSDNDIFCVPPEIASLSNLVELNLNISDLPEQLKECRMLMILDLSSNPITRLPETIAHCVSLTHLGLNDVSLTQLPADIGQLVNLRSLEARDNLIRSLPTSITLLKNLQVVDLGQNELDQLPAEMGCLESLRELYIDSNDLETLPEQITKCRLLEQLDASENRLCTLPEEFGDLSELTDVNLSDNELQTIPNSIGRLKKLTILKLEKNHIHQLTQSIGSCEQLTELFLTHNLLQELPSSIGNLRNLKNLNVDQNKLSAIPTTIGGCTALTVLSLRENEITEIPMDIGKCERLTVLDLCNNRLSHLPFTINVLFKLQALWLSENQSQAMLKLQVERDPRTGVKVLSCYLLPQLSAHPQNGSHDNLRRLFEDRSGQNRAFVGGPKVHFPDQDATVDDEKLPIGQFERHDTPHPKPQKLKKSSIDGHVIHHDGQTPNQPVTLALTKKPGNSIDTSPTTAPQPAPRSALKFQSVPPTEYEPEHSASVQESQIVDRGQAKNVAFASNVPEAPSSCRLKRINTPHFKGVRGSLQTAPERERPPVPAPVIRENVPRRIAITRDANGHLGLSIAGGLGSTPFIDGDCSLFVSRVTPDGPAHLAGLRVNDKLVKVNDVDVLCASHDEAVRAMNEPGDVVELTILRKENLNSSFMRSPDQSLDVSFMTDPGDLPMNNRETLSVTLKRDSMGSPGFAVASSHGGLSDGLFISYITPNGPAACQGKLSVGDRVVSINGTRLKGVRHDQAVALLTGNPHEDVYITVMRDLVPRISPHPLPSTPLITSSPTAQSPQPENPNIIPISKPPTTPIPYNPVADTLSWDGTTEEVILMKDGKSLGLSIVGGCDHSSHPFGVDRPGVFISKIAPNSPAARSQRLRIGDRILEVNDRDIRKAQHIEAVEALKQSGPRVVLLVTHEPQPPGMRIIEVSRKDGQSLGISIHGGVGKPAANPADERDEGIFVEKVEPSSVCHRAGLQVGHRLIEVNGDSLLGCDQSEAAALLRASNDLRILVCDGYNVPHIPRIDDRSITSTRSTSNNALSDENKLVSTTSISSSVANTSVQNGDHHLEVSSRFDEPPLASSSPLPTAPVASAAPAPAPAPKPVRVPPAVAPKPTLRNSQLQNVPPLLETANPEKLTFASKLKNFEREIEVQKLGTKQASASNLPLPAMKPLLSDNDAQKLKEDESRRRLAPCREAITPEEGADGFEKMLDDWYCYGTVPLSKMGYLMCLVADPVWYWFECIFSVKSRVTHTRKIEDLSASPNLISSEAPLNDVEKRAMEQQRRSEWRAARLKSLDQERAEADAIMDRLQLISLPVIAEDGCAPPSERILNNDISVERSVVVDAVTGERTVTLVEKSVTKREIDVAIAGGEIDFADK
ncbi:PDZ/DHR/GLGF domain protein [Ostertagia ostertagi]